MARERTPLCTTKFVGQSIRKLSGLLHVYGKNLVRGWPENFFETVWIISTKPIYRATRWNASRTRGERGRGETLGEIGLDKFPSVDTSGDESPGLQTKLNIATLFSRALKNLSRQQRDGERDEGARVEYVRFSIGSTVNLKDRIESLINGELGVLFSQIQAFLTAVRALIANQPSNRFLSIEHCLSKRRQLLKFKLFQE